MEKPKHIIFNGHTYGLSGRYYVLWNYGKKGVATTLHRAVWAFHNGPIPPNHHVHHKDGDPHNNDISNLECLPAAMHLSQHAMESGWPGSEANKQQLASINHMAKAWHASAEGKAWHSENGLKVWVGRELHKKNCITCGAEFETPFPTRAKYCGNNCKSKAQPIPKEQRTCLCCGKPFFTYRYGYTQTCSKECGLVLGVQRRRDNNGGQY